MGNYQVSQYQNVKGDGQVHFYNQNNNKNDQTKPKYFLSRNHMKFGMLKLDPNSTHHTKFEAIWRSF